MKCNSEWIRFQIDIILSGHHPEWAQSRTVTIPYIYNSNGHNLECTRSQMDLIPNGHDPEITQSRMSSVITSKYNDLKRCIRILAKDFLQRRF